MRKYYEAVLETLIFASGIASIIFVLLIFVFLLKEGLSLFAHENPFRFLFGTKWYPISEPPKFGILPMFLGSIWVTLGATVVSVPVGLACAIYIGEVAPKWLREILKVGVELLAAIPSIVLGFIGLVTLVPFMKKVFHLSTGLTAFSGSIMLAFMAMPTIVSIMEDALNTVPNRYRYGSIAMGATKWQTIYRIVLPAAAPGIVAAVMLGVGRVIGETMAVMMITGNAAVIPNGLKGFFEPVRTLTATIAAEMGEAVQGSEHYYALFAIGIVLFAIAFIINFIADLFLHRDQVRAQ